MPTPRNRNRCRGAAMAEFAVVAPLFFSLLFGVLQLGRALYAYHFVAVSARKAARYAIVRGAACTSFATACPAGASDIQTFVRGLAPGAMDMSSVTVATVWAPDHTPGSTVSVTVQYPFSLEIPFVPSAAITMKSSSQMVISQ